MLKYINSTLGIKTIFVIFAYFIILYSISNFFGEMNVNGSILLIIFFITGFFTDNKTKQINNIVLVLPLSRRKLWLAFYLRFVLFLFYIIAIDTLLKLIFTNSKNIFDDLISNYLFNTIILICLYNFNLVRNNFIKHGKYKSNIFSFFISFSSVFVSIATLITLSIMGMDIRKTDFNSLTFPEIVALLFIFVNVLYPFVLSYFITLKSKSLLNFRIS